jgi:hypothetical protein
MLKNGAEAVELNPCWTFKNRRGNFRLELVMINDKLPPPDGSVAVSIRSSCSQFSKVLSHRRQPQSCIITRRNTLKPNACIVQRKPGICGHITTNIWILLAVTLRSSLKTLPLSSFTSLQITQAPLHILKVPPFPDVCLNIHQHANALPGWASSCVGAFALTGEFLDKKYYLSYSQNRRQRNSSLR